MKIFVVSGRNSKRREKMKNYLDQFNINFKFCYSLPDRRIVPFLKKIKFHTKNPKIKEFSLGEVSCLLNHLKCIFYIYKKQLNFKNFLILEDDIKFRVNLKKYIEFIDNLDFEYDILMIGFPWGENYIQEEIDKALPILKERKDPNTIKALRSGFIPNVPTLSGQGYILSKSGIEKIGHYLNECLNHRKSLLIERFDWWILSTENNFIKDIKLKIFTFKKNIISHDDEGISERKKKKEIII